MSFFDTKEEVLDVQLTQFGKRLLSIGQFRPYFYAFFDDDILYDSSKASFEERQNSSEDRILNQTPKLKTQYLTSGISTHFVTLEDLGFFDANQTGEEELVRILGPVDPNHPLNIDEGAGVPGGGPNLGRRTGEFLEDLGGVERLFPDGPDHQSDPYAREGQSENYVPILEKFREMHTPVRNYNYDVQEKILLYPLANQEVGNTQVPSYDVVSLESKLKSFQGYQHFTASGIIKNVPQFEVVPKVELVSDRREQVRSPRNPSEEDHYDLTSGEVVFRDNTKIQLRKENLVFDIQELNTSFEKENFTLEIYEIIDLEGDQSELRKIVNPLEIMSLFHIKTDNTISHLHDYKTQREKNYQDRRRN